MRAKRAVIKYHFGELLCRSQYSLHMPQRVITKKRTGVQPGKCFSRRFSNIILHQE